MNVSCRLLLMAAALVWIATGCEQPSAVVTSSTNASVKFFPPLHLDHAQPKLQTLKLWVGAQEMVTELAITQTEVATGMMFRKEMAENEGMLFIFAHPHQTSFYMRNTTLPLSCAYIDSEGIIQELHDLQPLREEPVMARSDNIQYVLETRRGWFERNKVGVGALIRTERGSFQETFFK